MIVTRSAIPDVLVVEPQVFHDARGSFFEAYHQQKFLEGGIPERFVQDNQSISKKNVLRGLHYQIHQPQGKLVRVLSGEVFDVAVDLRKRSPHFGKFVSETLSSENRKMFWVPEGFAHGFLVLSDIAEVLYKTTSFYAPQFERTLLWNDPQIGIPWPSESAQLSEKDRQGVTLAKSEVFE